MNNKFKKKIQSIKIEHILFLIIIGLALCKMMTYMSTIDHSERDITEGDIKFYGRDSCPFCVKMKKLLQTHPELNSKIEQIDVETDSGAAKFKQINASGVPHFQCVSTGKSTSGYQPVEKLLDNLGLS